MRILRKFKIQHTRSMRSMEIHEQVKGLIFDLDGTLADSMPAHYKAWYDTLSKYGVAFSEELFYQWAGVPTFKIVALLNEMFQKNMDPMAVHHEKEEAFLYYIDTIQPVEAVAEVAYTYFGKLPMSIGTGGVPDVVEKTLKAIQMDSLFDVVVTSFDVKNHKPAPDTFLLCAEKMGVLPQDCQVFEDGVPGLQAAIAAGMYVTDVRPFYKKVSN